jgi:hypothetical protein
VVYSVTWTEAAPVASVIGSPGTPNIAFSIVMDNSNANDLLNWDHKLQAYAQETFRNTLQEVTRASDIGENGDFDYPTAAEDFTTGVPGVADVAPVCSDAIASPIQCSNLLIINQ